MGVPDVIRFAKALSAARRHLGLTQAGMSARLRVSLRSVVRWEHAELLPHPDVWERVLDALDDLPPAMLLEIAMALGGDPPAPHPPPPPPRLDPKDAILRIVYRVADALDVPASGVRKALILALAEMEGAGVSVSEGRAALDAQGQASRPSSAREPGR